jgi:hypothetical protein
MITTTYHVLEGMNGGSTCQETIQTGVCALDISSREKLTVPKVLGLLLVFFF